MPPVGSEGADSSSDDEDQADWAQNPLFDQGETTVHLCVVDRQVLKQLL